MSKKIIMVCLGNICRSPLAEGILKHLVSKEGLDWQVDSAGTSGWHNGELPDKRSIEVASQNGIDLTKQRSSKFKSSDYAIYDHILVMDSQNYKDVTALSRNDDDRSKVELILNYIQPGMNRAVPDPYYEGGFDSVYNMLKDACEAFLKKHS